MGCDKEGSSALPAAALPLPGTGTARRPGGQTNELGKTGSARRLPRTRSELHRVRTLHFGLSLSGGKRPQSVTCV